MTTRNAPTAWPTRKLVTGAMVASAVNEAWGKVMPDLVPWLAGSEVSTLAGALAALAVGYFVRDRA